MISIAFDENKDTLLCYYEALNDFEMPFGTESKYMNTEKLIKYSLEMHPKSDVSKSDENNVYRSKATEK